MQLSPDSIRSSARQVIASAQSLIVSGSEVAAGYDKNEVHDTRMSRPTLQNSSARNALLKLSTGKGKISTPNNDSFIGVRVLTKNDANDRTMLSIRFDMTNKIIYNDKRLDSPRSLFSLSNCFQQCKSLCHDQVDKSLPQQQIVFFLVAS